MPTFSPFVRVLLFIISTNLLVADVLRFAVPYSYQKRCLENLVSEQEEDIPANFSSAWEEEIKFHHSHEQFEIAAILLLNEDKTSRGHLIKDDVVHLPGFVSIFSPPPNCR